MNLLDLNLLTKKPRKLSFSVIPPQLSVSGQNQTEDPRRKPSPTQPDGLGPPSPAVQERALRLYLLQPLARIAGEGAERSEAGEGIPHQVLVRTTSRPSCGRCRRLASLRLMPRDVPAADRARAGCHAGRIGPRRDNRARRRGRSPAPRAHPGDRKGGGRERPRPMPMRCSRRRATTTRAPRSAPPRRAASSVPPP